jgi:hypothetical protein
VGGNRAKNEEKRKEGESRKEAEEKRKPFSVKGGDTSP